MSVLKPLHAKWIIELYDYMTSPVGRGIVLNGWRRAGILEAWEKAQSGAVHLEPLDPFHDIDPLLEMQLVIEPDEVNAASYSSKYTTERQDADDDESDDDLWEDDDGNILGQCIIEDDEDEHSEDGEHEETV